MFDARSLTLANLDEYLKLHTNSLVVALSFSGGLSERPFTEEDAVLASFVANLPSQGRLPLAFVSGVLSGADLAIALSCAVIALDSEAALSTGFGRPGSAAVYIACARRLGSVACERLLFGSKPAGAADVELAHLGEVVASPTDALALGVNRSATMLSVAKANLVTWPVSTASMRSVIDNS